MKLGAILDRTLRSNPDACALIAGLEQYTFRQVDDAARVVAAQIRECGVESGDRVALLVPNVPAFSIGYFACLRYGAIVVPINPRLTDHEISLQLNDCKATLMIVSGGQESRVDSLTAVTQDISSLWIAETPCSFSPSGLEESICTKSSETDLENVSEDTAVILYTSGTTGLPKGVELSHKNLIFNARSVSEEKFSTESEKQILGPGHIGLASLPLSHAFGQTNLQNGLWYGGAAIVYQNYFDPVETLDLMEANRVTFFAGVPTMIQELIRAGRAAGQKPRFLRYCVCGGAALSAAIKKEFQEVFGVGIQESYGLTETSPMISCQKTNRTFKAGCVGKPIDQCEIRVVDEGNQQVPDGNLGEILVRGTNVFKGYLGNPKATDEVFLDDWFRTGDLGLIDEDGEIRIVDRKKEIIKSGGYTVYPREIENVLLEIEGINQAVVIGIPEQKYGEAVKAIITLGSNEKGGQISWNPESNADTVIAEIHSVCKKKLAAYKRPRVVEIRKELPLGSTGKVDRWKLRTSAHESTDNGRPENG